MKARKYLLVLFISALLFVFSNSAWALVISGDRTGGQCGLFGTWNGKTKTCTLTRDVNASDYTTAAFDAFGSPYSPWYSLIAIDGSGVTIDGNGHTISGGGGAAIGIRIETRKRNNTIKNLTISGFNQGILLYGTGEGNSITGNTITGNSTGVLIRNDSKNNIVSDNRILNNGTAVSLAFEITSGNVITNNIISGNGSGGNLGALGNIYTNNTVSNNSIGLTIGSENNVVTGNTFSGSSIEDLRLQNLTGNSIYNNNFMSVKNLGWVLDDIYAYSTNQFDNGLPSGGNYWSNYDSLEEGCSDADVNGICDQPLNLFATSDDSLPWATEHGWPVESGGSGGGDSGDGGSTKGGGKPGGSTDDGSGGGGGKGGGGKPTR